MYPWVNVTTVLLLKPRFIVHILLSMLKTAWLDLSFGRKHSVIRKACLKIPAASRVCGRSLCEPCPGPYSADMFLVRERLKGSGQEQPGFQTCAFITDVFIIFPGSAPEILAPEQNLLYMF